MQKLFLAVSMSSLLILAGCQPNTGNAITNSVNTNANLSNTSNNNTNSNANVAVINSNTTISETKEPDQYQAIVQLKLEATGEQKTAAMPAISANVARNAADRRMEFNLPNGDKVVYLDKAGTTYMILPNRKQYAILDKESLGFDVRQLLMPEQIVNQLKTVKGVERVGEENVNGRQAIRYRYGTVTNTQTKAGQVETESFFLIDKETGLPLHSETVSQSQGNVQGLKGLRIITEMSDIKTQTTPELFTVPTDFQKMDPTQVKAQADLIFNTATMLLSQVLKTAQSNPNSDTNSNMATPSAAK
ncbi:MAG: hypothetical protein ABJA66_16515 [Actinomycetota bacterium]